MTKTFYVLSTTGSAARKVREMEFPVIELYPGRWAVSYGVRQLLVAKPGDVLVLPSEWSTWKGAAVYVALALLVGLTFLQFEEHESNGLEFYPIEIKEIRFHDQ